MHISRSAKIKFLLVVDVVFFFIELIAGYAVGSLALVADSFHMLNDVLSLIVALYAIKLSNSEASPRYSYGWHRAEIVAALTNGVFLLALCFSIFMEAIERFFNTPEISNPKLVVIVGFWGLLSNFLGLILFHEHTHSHGPPAKSKAREPKTLDSSVRSSTADNVTGENSALSPIDDSHQHTAVCGHPAVTRASIVQAAQDIGYGGPSSATASPRRRDVLIDIEEEPGSETYQRPPESESRPQQGSDQGAENGQTPHQSHGKGAKTVSSGSMNMHALILHVIGDALGNVGVIATGLVIWLSTWQYKYYFDPVISLIITCIIFSSAMPLVRSTSFILLQAVPPTISLKEIREDIQNVPGVLSVHELHIWQLSETKMVASVHVWVSRKRDYMHVTQDIRKIMHDHGVHSSTVQPEVHSVHDSPSEENLITDQETHCLIPCPPDQVCAPENACCPPQKPPSSLLVDV